MSDKTFQPDDFAAVFLPRRKLIPAGVMVYLRCTKTDLGTSGPTYMRSYSRPDRARAAIASGAATRAAAHQFNRTLANARRQYPGEHDPYGDNRARRARFRNLAISAYNNRES